MDEVIDKIQLHDGVYSRIDAEEFVGKIATFMENHTNVAIFVECYEDYDGDYDAIICMEGVRPATEKDKLEKQLRDVRNTIDAIRQQRIHAESMAGFMTFDVAAYREMLGDLIAQAKDLEQKLSAMGNQQV